MNPRKEKAPISVITLARGVTAKDGSSHARIERAALILFTQTSIDQVTTKEIAAAAGLSEGLIYRYASSKIDLAHAMFTTIHTRLGKLVRETGSRGQTIDDKIRGIVTAYTQCADEDWELFSYHLLNTHRFLKQDQSTDNPVNAAEDIIEQAMANKQIPHGDKTLITGMALGIILQPALHKAYGRLRGNLSAYNTPMTKAVLSIIHQT